jgi:hypothetical protein
MQKTNTEEIATETERHGKRQTGVFQMFLSNPINQIANGSCAACIRSLRTVHHRRAAAAAGGGIAAVVVVAVWCGDGQILGSS